MSKKKTINENELLPVKSQFMLYQTEDGRTRIEVRLQDETVWLAQKLMAELFQKDLRTINEHIQNIFEEGELIPESAIRKLRITAADGKNYETSHYNLNVIISVGYRVRSHRGTQFRIRATQRLREYIIKGFTLDDERLKQAGGGNYFDELLARIRDIRSSEKVFWSSGEKCSMFMPPASITTPTRMQAGNFSPSSRTRCTGPHTGIPPPRLLPHERTRSNRTWA